MKRKLSAELLLTELTLSPLPTLSPFPTLSPAYCTRSKRPKLCDPLHSPTRTKQEQLWLSATDTRNYMIRDPLVDWLKLYKPVETEQNEFFDFITNKGREFEQKLVEYIHTNKIPVVSVSDKITLRSCRKTIELMKNGTPIIHSAPFRCKERHTKGVIDLLVRSDYLEKLVDENPIPNYTHIKAPNLNGNYHYVVIDIKFSTLPLRADGIHLLNSDSYPAYKAQLWIYTDAIGIIQGYTSQYAFILGRRWKYTSRGEDFSGTNCLDKLGVIDFQGVDEDYKTQTKNAISWIRDLRKQGQNWSIQPPTRGELYPNMCVDSGSWNKVKQQIADELGDITSIWYCGINHRENALKQGISSWRDPRCTSRTIGLNGVRAPIVDKIMDINRQSIDKIRPTKITSNLYNWKEESNEVFVDFETFIDVFAPLDNLPTQPKTDGIFMIGVYYLDNGNWQYKSFTAKNCSRKEEFRIMNEFIQFIHQQKYPKMWYWHAEQSIWTRAENRIMDYTCEVEGNGLIADYIVDNWKLENWADLAVLFREEPIVIKDCFKFGLKEVSSAMRKHGLITSKIESVCDSGLSASVKAWNVYNTVTNAIDDPVIKDIEEYNKFDVKVLQEILSYLRKNHT